MQIFTRPAGLVFLALMPMVLIGTSAARDATDLAPPASDDDPAIGASVVGYQVASDGRTLVTLAQRDYPMGTSRGFIFKDESLVEPVVRARALPDRITPTLWDDMNGPPVSIGGRTAQRPVVVTTIPSELTVPTLSPLVARTNSKYAEVLADRRTDLEAVRAERSSRFDDLVQTMTEEGCTDIRVSALADLISADCDLDSVRPLALHEDVRLVSETDANQTQVLGINADSGDDPLVARGDLHLNTDLIRDQITDPDPWYIGVVDSGVNDEHDALFFANTAALDCVHGLLEPEGGLTDEQAKDPSNYDPGCYTFLDLDADPPGWDPTDCTDHGTPITALLVADDTFGESHRGMTDFGVDSYKVSDACSEFNEFDAIQRALEQAVLQNQVVNLSFGHSTPDMDPDTDPYALLADGAYDFGLVVVASSGNLIDLECPGCSHKTLTVGHYDIGDLGNSAYEPTWSSGWGYTLNDNRIKPDVMGPSGLELASATGLDAFANFQGTSFSAPAVTAAATLTRALLSETLDLEDPGYTYASMILQGRGNELLDAGTGESLIRPDTGGAGAVRLDSECTEYQFGKVTLTQPGQAVDIPIEIDDTYTEGISAAIWWPESSGQDHNDIDLVVFQTDPTDPDFLAPLTYSQLQGSVFEKVSTPTFLSEDTYYVSVEAWSLDGGPQEVYVAIRVGGCSFADQLQQP